MPNYDYQCINGHVTEQLHLIISEAPYTITCPKCKKKAERIISSGAGFTFKQPGGTYTGAKKEAEVQQAMKDYASGAEIKRPSKDKKV